MLKALSIQIQPERAPELKVDEVKRAFEALTKSTLVERHEFNEGFEGTHYLNFTFGTEDLKELWSVIQFTIFDDPFLSGPVAKAAIVICEGNDGWNDYLQLFHFDPLVPRDSIDSA